MKKKAGLFLTVVLLCTLCFPVAAESKDVADILGEAEKKMSGFVQLFEYNCLCMPITINPVIFSDLNVDIDGKEVDFNSVACLGEAADNTEDRVLVVPNEEEYVEPIMTALGSNFPFHLIETEANDKTNRTQIIVALPEMAKKMRDTCKNILNAYWTQANKTIDLVKLETVPRLMAAGGSDADKGTLDVMCDEAISKLNAEKDKYEEYIRARRDLYLAEHPEDADEGDTKTASVLSEGNLIVMVGVATFVVGFLTSMLIFRKKKPVSVNGATVEDSEEEDEL